MQNIRFFCLGIILCFIVFDTTASDSQNKGSRMSFRGCSGGMMLHVGYAQSGTFTLYDDEDVVFHDNIRTASYGIGGAMRVMFGNHLRIGMEGYTTKSKISKYGGFTSAGWGGLLLDSKWDINKWTVFVGAAFGGGGFKSVFIADYDKDHNNLNDFVLDDNVSYRTYPFVAVDPFVGFEYAITKKVHLFSKIDYLLNVSNNTNDFVTGPRLFFGIMFYHWK